MTYFTLLNRKLKRGRTGAVVQKASQTETLPFCSIISSHARMSFTTTPATSVSRSSRPWWK